MRDQHLRIARATALMLGLALAAGCSGGASSATPAPPPAPELPDLAGSWRGSVNVEGQGIDGSLTLRQDGSQLEAVFLAPAFGLRATGDGTVSAEGAVTITLSYNLQCPGEAIMAGQASTELDRLEGNIDAGDCTGSMRGSFRFTR